MRDAEASTGYLLGSYGIATAPEPISSRLTSFKSRCFDSPANNVGPRPTSLGCTTNSYSSINPHLRQRQRELHASHEQPLARLPFQLLNGLRQIPSDELRVPVDMGEGARYDVLHRGTNRLKRGKTKKVSNRGM